jgi:hypothetical protein
VVSGITLLAFLLGCFILVESPRFLISTHQYERAAKELNTISKVNRKGVVFTRENFLDQDGEGEEIEVMKESWW